MTPERRHEIEQELRDEERRAKTRDEAPLFFPNTLDKVIRPKGQDSLFNCPYCNSTDVVEYEGEITNPQEYICWDCDNQFTLN